MRNSRQGFSLLEVLVAVSILGICLALIVGLFGQGLNSISISRDYTKAALAAKNVLATGLTDPNLLLGTYTGEESGHPWTMSLTQYEGENQPDSDAPVQLWQVTVSVSWQSRMGEKTLTLESLRAVTKPDKRIMAPDMRVPGGRPPGRRGGTRRPPTEGPREPERGRPDDSRRPSAPEPRRGRG